MRRAGQGPRGAAPGFARDRLAPRNASAYTRLPARGCWTAVEAVPQARAGRSGRAPGWAGRGGVAEWLKAHAWNACIPETVSRVRIPLPPPAPVQASQIAHIL